MTTALDNLAVLLVAAVLGSFVGAVTYRLPRGLGFIKGRSFCDYCHKPLGWKNNIPLVSFLLQWGKSDCCGKALSIRYFLIELASVISALYLFSVFALPLFIIHYALFIICLAIFVIDWEFQFIPDELVWVVLLLSPYAVGFMLYENLAAGFLSALMLLFIHLVTRGRGMGLGDVKLALALGAWLGLSKSAEWIFGAFLTGGVLASILLITGQAKMKHKIAFGPFLIASFLYVYFFR